MSHIISYTEEIEETGFGPERPALGTGERYLFQVGWENAAAHRHLRSF